MRGTLAMQNQFSRTQLLFGKPAIETLMGSRVAVFGVGGVGGYVVQPDVDVAGAQDECQSLVAARQVFLHFLLA